jgi:hypothetical protein
MRDDASVGRIVSRKIEFSWDKKLFHCRAEHFFGVIVAAPAIASLLPTLRRDEGYAFPGNK